MFYQRKNNLLRNLRRLRQKSELGANRSDGGENISAQDDRKLAAVPLSEVPQPPSHARRDSFDAEILDLPGLGDHLNDDLLDFDLSKEGK